MSLSLPRTLLDHETLMLAVLTLARDIARTLTVSVDATLAESCRVLGVNRTSVYEQRKRVLESLEQLAEARPGRPSEPVVVASTEGDSAAQQLTIEVLEYLLAHPGAKVCHGGRTDYSPNFRRLVLARHDRWTGTQEDLAAAVRVPLDTLRDWLRSDEPEALDEPAVKKPTVAVPRDAPTLVRAIVEFWQAWEGPTRSCIGQAAVRFGISTDQVTRVLKIFGCISPRRQKPPRYRGTTHALSPGTMLVTDGKQIDVELAGSGRRTHRNWQGIVDQTTGCDTAVVITKEECAAGIGAAYDASLACLGGVVPDGLLHDNKPCHDDAELRRQVESCGTTMIAATPGRGENKAIIEGAFGLWEQRVGTIRLDDTSIDTLITSAVSECVRCYTSATNNVPRTEWGGRSRLSVLREACPGEEQRRRDALFLKRLKSDHDPSRRRLPKPNPVSAPLLDEVFQRLDLLDKDPKGSLRRYLAVNEPAAIRRAAAIVTAKHERGALDERYVHRYLVKVIQGQQHELDLERAAAELFDLCEAEGQLWTANEERDYQRLVDEALSADEFILAVAEQAAHAGLPLQTIYWTGKLLELLGAAVSSADAVKRHLVRLYEADPQRRLSLIDQITAQEHALAR